MAFAPIAYTIPQYDRTNLKNYWLKAYEQGTTTPKVMALDADASATYARIELDTQGFPITSGGARFIPFIDGYYDLWAFPTATEADANDTTNAIQFADNINANPLAASGIFGAVGSISDLRAFSVEEVGDGDSISVTGYYVAGDGGGGSFYWDSASTEADNGGTIIQSSGVLTGRWKRNYSGSVNVLWFGAYSDGTNSTATTQAIQGAIDFSGSYGSVYIPAGQYFVSSTITVRNSFITIYGEGSGSTEIFRTDGNYGDTFDIASSTPSNVFLLSVNLKGFKVRANVEMNANAHLHLQEVTQSTIDDVFLEDGYVGLLGAGLRNIQFTSLKIESGKYFSTLKSGSRFVRIVDTPNTSQKNSEIGFSNFNWTFTVNATIEIGLEIEACDGIWFDNGHILGGATTEMLVEFSGGNQLTGLLFSNVWFDGFTDTNVIFSGAPGVIAKDLQFTGCVFSGADTYCVWANTSAVFQDAIFTGCKFQNCDAIGVRIFSGSNWTFSGCSFNDINRLAVANSYAIKVENATAVNKITISGCDIGKASSLDYGIWINRSDTSFAVSGNNFEDVQINELEVVLGVELDGNVSGNNTDRTTYQNIPQASTMVVPAIAEICNVTGATGSIDIIEPRWDGRTIAFRGDSAAHTINHGTGNIINQSGTNTSLGSNRALNYQYIEQGSSYYQIG